MAFYLCSTPPPFTHIAWGLVASNLFLLSCLLPVSPTWGRVLNASFCISVACFCLAGACIAGQRHATSSPPESGFAPLSICSLKCGVSVPTPGVAPCYFCFSAMPTLVWALRFFVFFSETNRNPPVNTPNIADVFFIILGVAYLGFC